MGTITKKVTEQVCDISKKPVKKSDMLYGDENGPKPFIVGDRSYAEVAMTTVDKIYKLIESLDVTREKKPRGKKAGDTAAAPEQGISDPTA
jgi:hypothetical protein